MHIRNIILLSRLWACRTERNSGMKRMSTFLMNDKNNNKIAESTEKEISYEELDFTPVTMTEPMYQSLIVQPPNQPLNPKTLKISVLGMPNAGKSSFINAILGRKLMATSSKIDTTIENTLAVRTVGDTQILIQDTPGIVNSLKAKRHKISHRRVSQPNESYFEADFGIIVGDLTSTRLKDGFLQPEILMTMIKNRHVPTILVLNKADQYTKKDHLLMLIYLMTGGCVGGVKFQPEKKVKLNPMRLPRVKKTVLSEYEELDLNDESALRNWLDKGEHSLLNKLRHCRGWPHFQEVFVISAKERQGIDQVRNYMLNHAKPGPWQYHSDLTTDASPKQIIMDSVRAGLLEHLPQEIPYCVIPNIDESSEIEDGRLYVRVEVICRKINHYNIVLHKARAIANDAQNHLQDVFFVEAFVHISPVFVKNVNT